MNPNAINFNPEATEEDFSCVYEIESVVGIKQNFEDVERVDMKDTSFTLSYSVEGKCWVFFHQYIPDFYFHTREQLWSAKANQLYKHNAGPFGQYYKSDKVQPFIVDVVFKSDSDMLLETVSWISECLSPSSENSSPDSEFETLTHISIWNSQQHTGRIALKDLFESGQFETSRRTKGRWSFNHFRNALQQRGAEFLTDVFNDYKLKAGVTGEKSWYDKELIQDKYFVIRFEFDNSSGKQLVLHQTNVQVLKHDR